MHHQQQPQTKRGQAFFRQQVWQSNSSLETCKVSRETNWPFDTAANKRASEQQTFGLKNFHHHHDTLDKSKAMKERKPS